ncbi:hypothetical protein KAU88_05640 [Candidatus Bathyarchaeota archaeon]|nr:hypothetical protein [Candidatus Bathyarchaeota archaeon]
MTLRGNWDWLIGSISTGLAVGASLLVSSEVFAVLIGTLVGLGVSYFVQSRTQKRAWKREYSVKIVEEVYGALFKEFQNVLAELEKKVAHHVHLMEWSEIKRSYKYFMVDKEFRRKIDFFDSRLSTFSDSISRARDFISDFLVEETRKAFGIEGELGFAKLNVVLGRGKRGTARRDIDLVECVLRRKHPKEAALEIWPGYSIQSADVEITGGEGQYDRSDLRRFEEYWEKSLERAKRNIKL